MQSTSSSASHDQESVSVKPRIATSKGTTAPSHAMLSRGARSFGAIIDVNSPPRRLRRPSPIRSVSSLLTDPAQLNSSSALLTCKFAAFNASSTMTSPKKECNNNTKASSKFAGLLQDNCPKVVTGLKASTPGKRKYSDENCTEGSSADGYHSEPTTVKRVSTIKKKKELNTSKSEPVSPSKKDDYSKSAINIPLSTIHSSASSSSSKPSTSSEAPAPSSVLDLYSKEQQLRWMTEKDGQNDLGYYHVLIEQRFKALQETWAENDTLEKDIRELERENELLEPMFQQIIELKQMLFADEEEEGGEDGTDSATNETTS